MNTVPHFAEKSPGPHRGRRRLLLIGVAAVLSALTRPLRWIEPRGRGPFHSGGKEARHYRSLQGKDGT